MAASARHRSVSFDPNAVKQEIARKAADADAGWGVAYGKFARVVESRGLKRGAEIGVAFGGHAESILRETTIECLYGVDPYRHSSRYEDAMNLPQYEFDMLYEFMLTRLAPYGGRFESIRAPSTEAARRVVPPLDFVYIDAVHTCRAVWTDLKTWTPIVRSGGIVGGHDYDHVSFPGLTLAVDEFCHRLGWTVHYEGDHVWWTERGELPDRFQFGRFNCGSSPLRRLREVADPRIMGLLRRLGIGRAVGNHQ